MEIDPHLVSRLIAYLETLRDEVWTDYPEETDDLLAALQAIEDAAWEDE